jgi:hypothetical protein
MLQSTIEIKSGKTKLAGLLAGAAIFVALGIWFTLEPQRAISPVFQNISLIRVLGIASVIFFGLCGLFILKKLMDKKAALTISAAGITDNSSAVSVGFIPWADVVAIRETAIINQSFVTIDVNDPELYISKQTSSFKKKLMQVNYKQYGALINVSANALECNHHQLKAMLEDAFKNYQAGNHQA